MNKGYLVSQADLALEQHRLAKASGEPAAIASTRADLLRVKRELEHVKSERDTLALVKSAHRRPMLLGTR
jgi:hypothetical protein